MQNKDYEEFDSEESLESSENFFNNAMLIYEKIDTKDEKEYADKLMQYMELMTGFISDNRRIISDTVSLESLSYLQQELDKIQSEKPLPPKNLGENGIAFQDIIIECCNINFKIISQELQEMQKYPLWSQRLILNTPLDTSENHQKLELLKEHDKSLGAGIGQLRFNYNLLQSEFAQDYFEYLLKNPREAYGHASLLYELIELGMDSEKNRNAFGNDYWDAYGVAAILETCRSTTTLAFQQGDYDLIAQKAKFINNLNLIMCFLKKDDIFTRENFNAILQHLEYSDEIFNILKKHRKNFEPISQEKFNLAIKQGKITSIPSLKNQHNNLLWEEPIIQNNDSQNNKDCTQNNLPF